MESEERREERMDRRDNFEHAPRMKRKGLGGTPLWVSIGAAVLIVLLLVWLSIALFTGDTDVNFIALPSILG